MVFLLCLFLVNQEMLYSTWSVVENAHLNLSFMGFVYLQTWHEYLGSLQALKHYSVKLNECLNHHDSLMGRWFERFS
mgnify:CR=1 FL=1